MLTTGIFPGAFKVSKVIPLYKKGDSSLLVSYRPISLLPTTSKIFEKVIYGQLYEYFDKYNLLAEQQYGFHKQHSTEYAAGTQIERVESFNFPGIMLDENETWKSHIEMVGKNISKITGILYRHKNIFAENVLFVLYNCLVVSYINYGLLLWGVHVHKLELLQKKGLRFMTNSASKVMISCIDSLHIQFLC